MAVIGPAPAMQEEDDEALVKASKRGDAAAMERLYHRYRDWAFRLAYGFTGNAHDAEEVVQDVFRQFFARVDRFEMRSKLTTFLYTMVKHRSIDLIRKRRPTETLAFDPVAPALRDEDRERRALLELVASLPEKQREVVVLRFGEGLQLDEIAGRMDIAIGTVKSRLHHALAALRNSLG